ncbi:MAG TPA: MFS transporter [Anaerolineae bacterium]
MLTRLLRPAAEQAAAVKCAAKAVSDEDDNYRNLMINGAWFGPIDGGVFNYLPVFLARLGASPAIIGLLTSGPAFAGILAYIPGGAYTERHSDLVKLGSWTSVIARLAYPLIALLPFLLRPADIPLAAVIIWTIMSVPMAVYIPAWTTVMQQAVSPRRRAELNGTRWALFSLVSGGSILLFGLMLDRVPSPFGYQIVFLVSFVSALVSMYYFAKVRIPPFQSRQAAAPSSARLDRQLRDFFRPLVENKDFARYTAATLPYRLAFSLPIALFSVYWVDNLHASNTWIGWRGVAGYAALVVGYRTWGRVANRLGHRNLLLLAGGVSALYPILTALAPTAPWLLPAAAVWGLTVSGTDIGFLDMLLATCPPGRQPRFAAISNMLTSVMTFVAPLIGGGLAQIINVQTALLVAGALQLITTAFFLLLPGREQEGLA